MYHVSFYATERGDSPVEEFMAEMDSHTRGKTAQFIELLKEFGPRLKRPFADKLEGKIYELRPKRSRLLYFFFIGQEIVFVHGFIKKTNAVERRDLELAQRRMNDYLRRR